jgi:hypothetical protein
MKFLHLLSLFLLILFGAANAQSDLLSRIDTNIVLNYNGEPLRYHQYIKLLKTGEFGIITKFTEDYKSVSKELIKYPPSRKKDMKMDQASIEKRIAGMFGIREKLPLSDVDTTIKVYNTDGKLLAYYQYAPLVLNRQFNIMNEKGKRYLKPRYEAMMKIAGADNAMFNAMKLAFNEDDGVSTNNSLYWGLMKADRIRVEKSKRKLYIERNNKILYEFPINLGNHPVGHKQKEGDGRTPEGSYFIDYNINSKAAYKLGLHISYPNDQDLLNAKKMGVKPGGDVMIHGTSPERSNRKDWTNGCIAVSNENLDIIQQYYYNSIPIQINK